MKAILLVKEIYLEGFRNIANFLIGSYLKVFTWFTLSLIAIIVYAFIYRLATGFAFS